MNDDLPRRTVSQAAPHIDGIEPAARDDVIPRPVAPPDGMAALCTSRCGLGSRATVSLHPGLGTSSYGSAPLCHQLRDNDDHSNRNQRTGKRHQAGCAERARHVSLFAMLQPFRPLRTSREVWRSRSALGLRRERVPPSVPSAPPGNECPSGGLCANVLCALSTTQSVWPTVYVTPMTTSAASRITRTRSMIFISYTPC